MKLSIARFLRWLPPTLAWLVIAGTFLVSAKRSTEVTAAFGLPVEIWSGRVLLIALFGAMASFLALAYRLIRTLLASGREFLAVRKANEGRVGFAESGVVMVEFTLIAPTVWWIMAMTVQMALIAQASIVVRYSAYAAARSAIVLIERDEAPWLEEKLTGSNEDKAKKAAELVLTSLSPRTPGTSDSAATAMRDIFASQNGVWGDKHFSERFKYTRDATTVTIEEKYPDFEIPVIGLPIDVSDIFSPRLVRVTVKYLYLTKIPGMTMIPDPGDGDDGKIGEVAPNGGWAFPITQVVELQSTGARQGNAAIVAVQIVLGEAFP